ncbi:unnamed protein product, partial [Effrenium voratum]
AYWRSSHEPVASRAVTKLRQALAEVVGLAVLNVVQEMKSGLADPRVQAVGVTFLRAVSEQNGTAKEIIQRAGVVEVLVQSMNKHAGTEHLLADALSVLDELHGLPALLQALVHLRHSAAATRAALQTFRTSARARWHEVEAASAAEMVRCILLSLQAHPQDLQVLLIGVQVLGDLAGDLPQARVAFFNLGGWEWLLRGPLDLDHLEMQQEAIRTLAQLCRGGAGESYAVPVGQALERSLQKTQNDGKVLYWGLWAVQQLHGVGSLLATLRKTQRVEVVRSTLRSLSDITWGQGDGAGVEVVVQVVEGLIDTMRSCQEHSEVLNDAAFALSKAAAFAGENEAVPQLKEAAVLSASVLLELLQAKISDVFIVRTVLDALGELLQISASALKARICEGLFAGSPDSPGSVLGAGLLSKVSMEHESVSGIQAGVMWVAGLAHGLPAIVREMSLRQTSFNAQISALRAIAAIYQQGELATSSACMSAVLGSMSTFPENLVLWKNACYTLTSMVEHGVDPHIPKEQLLSCLQAGAKALTQAQSQEHAGYYKSEGSYLREESIKLIAAVCIASPDLSCLLRPQGEALGQAMEMAVSRLENRADQTAEEVEILTYHLMALVYVVGPEFICRCLQQWGSNATLARASAQVVTELMRRKAPVGEDVLRGPVSTELAKAAEAHKDDADVQSRVQLALGFMYKS